MKAWIKLGFKTAMSLFCCVLSVYLDIYAFSTTETRLLVVLIPATLASGFWHFSHVMKIIRKIRHPEEEEEDYYYDDL